MFSSGMQYTGPIQFSMRFAFTIENDVQGKNGEDISDSGECIDSNKPSSNDDNLEEDIVESDIELDTTDVVQPDNDPPEKVIGGIPAEFIQCSFLCWKALLFLNYSVTKHITYTLIQMGDASIEVTEESRDAAQEFKSKAVEAISEGIFLYLLLPRSNLLVLLILSGLHIRKL